MLFKYHYEMKKNVYIRKTQLYIKEININYIYKSILFI